MSQFGLNIKYRQIFESMNKAVAILTLSGHEYIISDANEMFSEICFTPIIELLGSKISHVLPQLAIDLNVDKGFSTLNIRNDFYRLETVKIDDTTTGIFLEKSFDKYNACIRSKTGKNYYFDIFNTEISAITLIDSNRNIIEYNKASEEYFKKTFGVSIKGEKSFDKILNKVPKAEKQRFLKRMDMVLSGETTSIEREFNLPNSGVIWFKIQFQPVYSDGSMVDGLLLQFIESTEGKKLKKEIVKWKNLFYTSINYLDDFIIITDDKLRVLAINEALEEFKKEYNLDKDVFGLHLRFVLPTISENVINEITEVVRTGIEREFCFIISTNNTNNEFEVKVHPAVFENGGVKRVLIVLKKVQKVPQNNNSTVYEERFCLIKEGTSDGIFSINSDGEFLDINRSGANMLRYSKEELLGKSIFNMTDIDKYNLKELLSTNKNRRAVVNYGVFERKDNTKFNGQMYLSPVLDDKIYGIIKYLSDSDRTSQEINNLKEKVLHFEKKERVFLSLISKKLRKSLNNIIGYSELLREISSEEERNEYLNILEDNSLDIYDFIEDLSDLSKIKNGVLDTENSTFSIEKLVSDIKKSIIMLELEKPKIEVNYLFSDKLKEKEIYTDYDKLKRSLIKILKNAINYTEEGVIDFSCDLSDDHIKFYIKDTGIGIDEDKKSDVFKDFNIDEVDILNLKVDIGASLFLVKSFIEALDGNIWFDSEVGKGSSFYINIPIERKNGNNSLRDSSDIIFKNKTVLIVEDDDLNFKYLSELLLVKKMVIYRADNGKEAISFILDNTPDIVLLDIQIPLVNGLEVLRTIREKGCDIPVIVQSAFAMPEDKEKSFLAGADEFIDKPIKKDKLLDVLRSYLFD